MIASIEWSEVLLIKKIIWRLWAVKSINCLRKITWLLRWMSKCVILKFNFLECFKENKQSFKINIKI